MAPGKQNMTAATYKTSWNSSFVFGALYLRPIIPLGLINTT